MALQLLKVDLLLQELKNVEWDTLGTFLGFGQNEIRQLERDHQTTERKRIEMLDLWLRKELDPSWDKIIAALENMSEISLASQLRKKYLQQINSENPIETTIPCEAKLPVQQAETDKVLKIRRSSRIGKKLESIKSSYARLLMNTESALEAAKISSRQLKRFSQQYMSDRVVTSVEQLFDCLGEFSFLDYALLEHTISIFLKEKQPALVCDLNVYIKQVKHLKKSATIRDFMETIENAQKSKEGITTKCTVTLHLVGGWLEKTMEDLHTLLKEIFQEKSSVLAHLTIVLGSVIVSYLAPQSEAESLIKLAQAKQSLLVQVGVHGLIIGQTAVISSRNETKMFSFESSLLKAVSNYEIDLLSFLLRINTSPDAADKKSQTALIYACYYGYQRAVDLLLQANANPNLCKRNGVTPLYFAIQHGHLDLVDILLQVNSNPNFCREDGVTPLSVAAEIGYSDTVSILLQANANPDLQRDDGVTPLYLASENGHSDTVSVLLQANVNPNLQRKDGATPLFIAAENGHSNIVGILLKADANPNLQRNDGTSPLIMATQNGRFDTVNILLQFNANPNLQADDGTTPLMLASVNSYPQIVKLLLTNGADPNVQHSDGFTALMTACSTGCYESTELLLKSGADTKIMNSQGLTANDIAVSKSYRDIIDLILVSQSSPRLAASISTNEDIMANPKKATKKKFVTKAKSYISKKIKRTKRSKRKVQTLDMA